MAGARDVVVHEGRPGRPARQRLDAHRSAPGEEVEDRRLLHHAEAAEGVEGGLPGPDRRWAGWRSPSGATSLRPRADPEITRIGGKVSPIGTVPLMTTSGPPDGVVVVRIDQGTCATP